MDDPFSKVAFFSSIGGLVKSHNRVRTNQTKPVNYNGRAKHGKQVESDPRLPAEG